VPSLSLFTCILELDKEDLEHLILRDKTHSDCTDENCKKFDVSDLETAGTRPLERKEEPASLEESDSLDATLEMSPSLDTSVEKSPLPQLDENDQIVIHQANICKLYKSIELSSFSELVQTERWKMN
jgi:hypothetical protein